MSYTSTYPNIFKHVLRYKNDVLETTPSEKLTAIYEEYDFWIGAALSYFAKYCNQPIFETAVIFSFNFNSLQVSDYGSYYVLPTLKVPIVISGVTYKETAFGDATTIVSGDRTLVNDNGLQRLYFSDPPTDAIGAISVTMGYTDSAMPLDLIKIIVEFVKVAFDESSFEGSKGRIGKLSVGEGLQGVSVNTAYYQLTSRHAEILDKYKVPIIL